MRSSTVVIIAPLLLLLSASNFVTANSPPPPTQSFSFVSIGDWGCVPIGGYYVNDELTVAKQFAKTAEELNARFVLNTGDNFYYCGVHNKSDAMWDSTYENVFTEPSTMVPWYNTLGNHDYGYPGSAEAQIEYTSPNHNRWNLPDRYYYKRLEFPGEVNISLLVLDASPCQSEYTSSDPAGWDPCGSVIPACPGCTFHQNVIKQNCSVQLAWMNEILATIPEDDWKVAMIHAPAQSIDNEDFVAPLRAAKFELFLNGHVHLLAHYNMDHQGTYITTGAGCMVRIPEAPTTTTAPSGTSKTAKEAEPLVMPPVKWVPSSCTGHQKGHSCQIVYQQEIAGYTGHTFSADFSTLTTTFYDYTGAVLYQTTTAKSDTL
ncbi:acid phosphatase, putative [Bodo saltans]|uniref:Acid phosphatase, putative n=1 Tax=Bodo saltans TaxID=75058 RepID=A0A0S4IP66_BODSA|nr:acid phosphatase, putative [Bodo saltans]|eukprot:CUE99784.1 acid phosphatase, putative [Bodo saltans]